MTDRIPLDNLTSDQYDQLCDQLEALRAVARGYCPACGRGDAAPTVEDWERERQRAERAEAALDRVRRYQQRLWTADDSRTMPVSAVSHATANALRCLLDEEQPAPGTDGLHARHVNVDLHNVCEYSVNRAALCLTDFIRAEFPGVHVTTDAREWAERTPGPGAGAATECPGHADCDRCDVTDPCPCCGLHYTSGQWTRPPSHRITAAPHNPEVERAATERAVQAAAASEKAAAWTPPPPGDKRDQLPDDILALIVLRPYVSTSCETAHALESAMVHHPDRKAELAMWRDRKHASCRLNNKSTGVLCACSCHNWNTTEEES